jgi:hypothetical protein
MVEQQPATGKKPKMFDYNSAEAKGGYARALKGEKKDAKGNLIDMETGLIYKDLRKTTKGGNKPLIKTNTPEGKMTGKEMVLMSKQGKAINPYAMAGFKTPFNQPAQQKNNVPQKTTQKSTNVSSRIMNYPLVQKILSNRKEYFNKYYPEGYRPEIGPFNPNGTDSIYKSLIKTTKPDLIYDIIGNKLFKSKKFNI